MKIKLLLLSLLVSASCSLVAQPNALNFDGVNDYVATTVSPISGNTAKTFEAWIRTTANALPPSSGGTGQKTIMDMGTFINGSRFTFNLLWSNAIRLEVGGNGLSDTTAVNDGQWHHVACVYDPSLSSNKVKLYVDGVLKTEGDLTVPVNTGSSVNVTIGRRIDNVNYFAGDIDEVRVWNVARSATDIAADMNAEICLPYPSSLYAYFRLNQGNAAGTNSGLVAVNNQLSSGNGTAANFAMTGATSNWITGVNLPGSSSSTMTISQCTPYTTSTGQVISATGLYYDTFTNAIGCDSILTYDATIGASTGSLTISQCSDYTTPSGAVLTSSGTYMDTISNSAGCDSVITITYTKTGGGSSSQTLTVCSEYISPAGNTYTASGIYYDTLANAAGCDSIITTDLTVIPPVDHTTAYVHCGSSYTDPIVGITYPASGLYVTAWQAANGCDSFEVLDLTLIDINISTTQNAGSITAAEIGASYQWLDCSTGQPIPGATARVFTPTTSGTYKVAITKGICMDTSYCESVTVDAVENLSSSEISYYPNPVSESLHLSSEYTIESIEVVNAIGQLMYRQDYSDKSVELPMLNLQAGIYFLRIFTSSGTADLHIMKE